VSGGSQSGRGFISLNNNKKEMNIRIDGKGKKERRPRPTEGGKTGPLLFLKEEKTTFGKSLCPSPQGKGRGLSPAQKKEGKRREDFENKREARAKHRGLIHFDTRGGLCSSPRGKKNPPKKPGAGRVGFPAKNEDPSCVLVLIEKGPSAR